MINVEKFGVTELNSKQQNEISGGFNFDLFLLVAGITSLVVSVIAYFENR